MAKYRMLLKAALKKQNGSIIGIFLLVFVLAICLFSALHASGQTVLLVTHDREAALRGNRVLYLEDGVITGELTLPAYEGKDKAREERLSSWLEGLGW